jgi:hypothetical protein
MSNPYVPDDDLEFEAEERANAPEPGDDAYIADLDLENELEIARDKLTDECHDIGIDLEWE